MKTFSKLHVVTACFLLSHSCCAYSARLTPDQVDMTIAMDNSVYRVYQDIPFQVVLNSSVSGELVTWDTTFVSVYLYKLDPDVADPVIDEVDSILRSDLDLMAENTTVVKGAYVNEWDITVYPSPELVSVTSGVPYIKFATFIEDIYPAAHGSATFLQPGHYKLEIEYRMSLYDDDDYEEDEYAHKKADMDFQITTAGDEAAAMSYWISVLRDADASQQAVMSAWEALSNYTDQISSPQSANKMDLGVRELAATEHSNWWQHYQSQLTLVVDDEKNEILQLPEGVACRCFNGPEISNYGDAVRTTSDATIDLAGDIGVGRRGVRFITVSNNRFPNQPVQGTRPSYVTWQATAIPLAEGENILTITAEDYIGDQLTTTITVNRTND